MGRPDHFYVRVLTAAEAATAFATFAETILPNESVTFNIDTNMAGLRVNFSGPGRDVPKSTALSDFQRTVKGRSHIICLGASATNQNNGNMALTYTSDDSVVATLKLNMSGDSSRMMKALEVTESAFDLSTFRAIVDGATKSIDQNAIALRERSVSDLQATVERLVQFQADLTKLDIERRQKLHEDMEGAHRERLDTLEAEYRSKQELLEQTRIKNEATLDQTKKDFDAKVAYYDLHEPKAKRRELLERIDKVLKEAEQFKVSDATAEKRKSIEKACILTIAVAIILIVAMVLMLTLGRSTDWHYFVGLGSGVLLFATTMVYYLKWSDQWFREHADSEFAAKRYKADILRASWVAELVQEWALAKAGEIPKDVIEAYTRNLFRDIGSSRMTEHPMDGISGLVKRATEITVGKGAFTVKANASGED